MTCDGCKHYQKTYETCAQLQGQVHCSACDRTWAISDRIGCPRCAEVCGLVDLGECPGAVPSQACPGQEEPPKVMEQRSLF